MARRPDEDFAAEIDAHLEHEAERLVGEGMTPEDARAAARRQFGNVTRARERFHESRRVIWLEQFGLDLRYAWRGMLHSRAFVATTVLTLAVGMGLVTVVFAIFNAYVLRPFAVHDPYTLYAVRWMSQESGGSTFRWADYEALGARNDLFDGVVAEVTSPVASAGQSLAAGFVSGNYFEMLGARVEIGRALVADDARAPGGESVVVLAHRVWTRLFDGDPSAIGRELDVNGRKMLIVGVMAAEFVGLDDVPRDIWIPITMYGADVEAEDLFGAGQPRLLSLTGRLRQGVTPEQAQGSIALTPFETRIAGQLDAVRASLDLRATPTRIGLLGLAALSPVLSAFVLVLVAACANASNVMLARANARHREIGIRLSIGASRGRLVRQLMTEGLLIAMLAGVVGLALAAALLRLGMFLFVELLPPTIAMRVRFIPLDFDYRVFLFVFLVAGAATVLFALLPALQATRVTLTDALRGHLTSAVSSSRLRNMLGASQVAASLVLLIVAVTLLRNGTAIRATDLGLDPDGIVSVRMRRGDKSLVRRAHTALTDDPRLTEVVVTSRNPLFGDPPRVPILQPSGVVVAAYTFVSPEYFAALQIPIVHGRGFSTQEAAEQARVAVVSAAGARQLWPGEDPVGKELRLNIGEPGTRVQVADTIKELRKPEDFAAGSFVVTVVGVAKDVVSGFVYSGPDSAHLYFPTSATGSRAAALMVRRPAGTSVQALKAVLRQAHPDPLAFDVLAMNEMVALQMFPLRAASWIATFLSAVALALSISGLYGVLTYTFGQRTREIGIRMALGATAAAVTRLVIVQSARLAASGTAIGLVLGFSVMKILSASVRLENVSVVDPGAFAVSIAVIAAAVAVSSYGPARRATRVDPSLMLRADA